MYLYPFKIFTVSKEKRILKDNGAYGGIYDAVKDNYIDAKEKAESIGAKVSILLGEVANDEVIEAWGKAYGEIADFYIHIEEEIYKAQK